jgi:ABC-2 type transport system ATP-binding protein
VTAQLAVGASPACVVRGLHCSYGEVRAVDGIDLDVAAGEVFGLLGPNGAGKSTFVRAAMGLRAPDAGSISLLGHDVTRHPDRAPRLASYLAQDTLALDDLRVGEAVELTGRMRGLRRAEARAATGDLLDELGLTPLVASTVGRLSGGERRLAAVATALVGSRPLLVLDEPTTGMDPVARRAVWRALDRRRVAGATVLLVTHNVLEAETVLDRVAVFDHGRVIACDTPGRLKASVSDEVRLDLVWRADPPLDDETVARLAVRAERAGRRWSLRLGVAEARTALAQLTAGPAFAALDDFTLATPSLEDVYLALGGRDDDLERS